MSEQRESSPEFRTYEEELELRLEQSLDVTEIDLVQELENETLEEIKVRHQRERKKFVERSASFNARVTGEQGAFAKYEPKRSSSFCVGIIGIRTPKPKDILRAKSCENKLHNSSSDSEEYVDTKRKRNKENKQRKVIDQRKIDLVKAARGKGEDKKLSVRRLSDTDKVRTKHKKLEDKKKVKPPVPVRRSSLRDSDKKSLENSPVKESVILEFPVDKKEEKTKQIVTLEIPIKEPEEEKIKESEPEVKRQEKFSYGANNSDKKKKGALELLYEEGIKRLQEKQFKSDEEDGSDNPFREQVTPPLIFRRPHSLKIRVGFNSSKIGQGLNTPPTEADTEEKTLPYFLKSQRTKTDKLNNLSKPGTIKNIRETGRYESNIKYEEYVELGKTEIKLETTEKEHKLEEAEVERRNKEKELQIHEQEEERPPSRVSLKKLELAKKVKEIHPDYSNEVREIVEPITPDTDQSEIEDILEAFSKDVKNYKEKKEGRKKPFLETAFLSSPRSSVVFSPTISEAYSDRTRTDTVTSPYTNHSLSSSSLQRSIGSVSPKSALNRGHPIPAPRKTNSLDSSLSSLKGNTLPDTSLLLENYVAKRKMESKNVYRSGRTSAPLLKQAPVYYAHGRSSVPIDHPHNKIPNHTPDRLAPVSEQEIFRRNQLRTRSLTREPKKSQLSYPVHPVLNYDKPPSQYTPSEIEALFWERLKQKKIKTALREQQIIESKINENKNTNFIRNTSQRATIGPIRHEPRKMFVEDGYTPQRATIGPIKHETRMLMAEKPQNGKQSSPKDAPRSQSALDFTKDKNKSGIPVKSKDDTYSSSKPKKLSKFFFFGKKKSDSKEEFYRKASDDYEEPAENEKKVVLRRDEVDNVRRVSSRSDFSSQDSDVFYPATPTSPYAKENLYNNLPNLRMSPRTVQPIPTGSRPLPPIPYENGYGMIRRDKPKIPPRANLPVSPRTVGLVRDKSDYGRVAPKPPIYGRTLDGRLTPINTGRKIPIYDTGRKTPVNPNMAVIPENDRFDGQRRIRAVPIPTVPTRSSLKNQHYSDTESGSEAGEVQRIFQGRAMRDEEWGGEGKGRGISADQALRDEDIRRGRSSNRRDDPRRHTLTGDHQSSSLARSMDLESPLPRGYPPPSNAMLFDDDPGIMSEVETASTGFRRGGKQRSSLPVVRTPSKTLERPLGLVFLQYRNETKRALLPNEITSIDTVKALFVRSFPKQLTMEYLDSPHVKIYIHDSNKDMFYELEDLRSHLRDIRDRSVLRLFESSDINSGAGGPVPGGPGLLGPSSWDADQSYFSEPEFDSEYQHQHIHKSKASKSNVSPQSYYMAHSFPPGQGQTTGSSQTLPRGAGGGSLLRAYSPAVPPAVLPTKVLPTSESGYMSSPERSGSRGYAPYVPGAAYEDPYYAQYGSRTGSITPVIDEEARIRVEHMERQLANLTGLVQKALVHPPGPAPPRDYLAVPNYRNSDKSVSFEKSVSFSDEPPDMNSPKQHSPQHSERDRHKPSPPPKPVSLSPGQYDNRIMDNRIVYRDLQLTPEMYNHLRGLQKKAKDLRQEMRNLRRLSQAQAHTVRETIRDAFIKIRAMLLAGGEATWAIDLDKDRLRLSREEDLYKQEMIRLEKDLTELESTVEELRSNVINRKTRVNMSDVEDMALILSKSSKTVADLKVRFPSLQDGIKNVLTSEMDRVVREEKFLKEEPERLESALRRCKKLTGTLVTLKRLASVQEQRLPSTSDAILSPPPGEATPATPPSLAHTKPSTGVSTNNVMAPGSRDDTQRPENALDALLDELQTFARPPGLPQSPNSTRAPKVSEVGVRKGSIDSNPNPTGTSSLRRLHSYPSSSDDSSPPQKPATGPKPPIPERNAELISQLAGRRMPPPPPPRTSSKSPLASPTSPSLPPRSMNPPSQPQMGIGTGTLRRNTPGRSSLKEPLKAIERRASTEDGSTPHTQLGVPALIASASNSSSCESVNSQEGVKSKESRKEQLEQRHQELLRKQKALQEQYARLQQLQRGATSLAIPSSEVLLKKTGSESNLLAKMGLGQNLTTAVPMSGSLTHLAPQNQAPLAPLSTAINTSIIPSSTSTSTSTTKVYETDIL